MHFNSLYFQVEINFISEFFTTKKSFLEIDFRIIATKENIVKLKYEFGFARLLKILI